MSRRKAAKATARYMAPVSRNENCNRCANDAGNATLARSGRSVDRDNHGPCHSRNTTRCLQRAPHHGSTPASYPRAGLRSRPIQTRATSIVTQSPATGNSANVSPRKSTCRACSTSRRARNRTRPDSPSVSSSRMRNPTVAPGGLSTSAWPRHSSRQYGTANSMLAVQSADSLLATSRSGSSIPEPGAWVRQIQTHAVAKSSPRLARYDQ